MVERLIAGFLTNFSLVMLILAVVLAVVLSRSRRTSDPAAVPEEMFRWVSLLAVGLVGLYTALMHVVFPQISAEQIGWATSPFQFEVGMADLTFGVLGVLAFRAGLGFRFATTIAAVIWLGGDAVGHVHQMVIAGNFAPGNAGPWFWTDVLVPLALVLSLGAIWRQTRTGGASHSAARSKQSIRAAL